MFKVLSSGLILTTLAIAQTAPSPSAAAGDHKAPAPVAIPANPATSTTASDFPPSTPVVTLNGFCPDAPAATDPKSPECKTVITKAQFERIIDTLNPKMPPQAREGVAADYAKMLVLADRAKKQGIEDTPHYKELISFLKMQVAAQELIRSMQEKAKPTDAELKKYYDDNASKYEEISLKRVFIPRNSPNAKPEDKKPTDDDLKQEAAKARARLASGEDFDKVQKDVYTAKGYSTPPPPTTIPTWRRESVPPNQQSLFDLKQGELSSVTVEPAGAYIYRLEEKKTTPLETVRAEIESKLQTQTLKDQVEALTSSVKPDVNEAYFKSLNGPPGEHTIGPASMSQHKPMMSPRTSTSSTAPQASPKTQ